MIVFLLFLISIIILLTFFYYINLRLYIKSRCVYFIQTSFLVHFFFLLLFTPFYFLLHFVYSHLYLACFSHEIYGFIINHARIIFDTGLSGTFGLTSLSSNKSPRIVSGSTACHFQSPCPTARGFPPIVCPQREG